MNLPNKLSILRILLVPLMMFFYLASFIPYGKIIAVAIFIGAAVTDSFDGRIARKRQQVTDLGKLLDPLADKMLYTCAFFLIVADGIILAPFGVLALSILFVRDSLINGIRQVAASKGVVVAAAKSGKLKAVLTDVYIPIFMFLAQRIFVDTGYQVFDIINLILTIGAYSVMGIATIVTIYSGIDYCIKNKNVFISNESKEPEKKDKVEVDEGAPGEFDPLLPKVLKEFINTNNVSISATQRKFAIGYARAARMMEQMEGMGYVSTTQNGLERRKVLISIEEFYTAFPDEPKEE